MLKMKKHILSLENMRSFVDEEGISKGSNRIVNYQEKPQHRFMLDVEYNALYGLTEGAIQNSREALVMTEAANLAQNLLEQLSSRPWTQNFTGGMPTRF